MAGLVGSMPNLIGPAILEREREQTGARSLFFCYRGALGVGFRLREGGENFSNPIETICVNSTTSIIHSIKNYLILGK